MKTEIGEIAGKIWEILGINENVSITQLPKMLNEKPVVVYQSLGWLAREDKITYHKVNNKTYVSQSDNKLNSTVISNM